jgi:hypothetical protein
LTVKEGFFGYIPLFDLNKFRDMDKTSHDDFDTDNLPIIQGRKVD